MAPKLHLQPITYNQACEFIRTYHRHHEPPRGWKFGVGVSDSDTLVGIATVGRPVARHLDDGFTLEVTRCCTNGTPNVASMLYGAARRAAKALGYRRLISYTLDQENGTSLRAAGLRAVSRSNGGSWNRKSRPRTDSHPIGPKTLWEATDL